MLTEDKALSAHALPLLSKSPLLCTRIWWGLAEAPSQVCPSDPADPSFVEGAGHAYSPRAAILGVGFKLENGNVPLEQQVQGRRDTAVVAAPPFLASMQDDVVVPRTGKEVRVALAMAWQGSGLEALPKAG